MEQRVYAKVRRGWNLVYLGFFFPGTAQEDQVALEVDGVLNRYQDAVASVSVECFGALRDLPVIGEFPMLSLSAPKEPKEASPLPVSGVMLAALLSMRDGSARQFTYREINTARALVRRGLAERRTDMPMVEYWISITPAGLAALEAK